MQLNLIIIISNITIFILTQSFIYSASMPWEASITDGNSYYIYLFREHNVTISYSQTIKLYSFIQ